MRWRAACTHHDDARIAVGGLGVIGKAQLVAAQSRIQHPLRVQAEQVRIVVPVVHLASARADFDVNGTPRVQHQHLGIPCSGNRHTRTQCAYRCSHTELVRDFLFVVTHLFLSKTAQLSDKAGTISQCCLQMACITPRRPGGRRPGGGAGWGGAGGHGGPPAIGLGLANELAGVLAQQVAGARGGVQKGAPPRHPRLAHHYPLHLRSPPGCPSPCPALSDLRPSDYQTPQVPIKFVSSTAHTPD